MSSTTSIRLSKIGQIMVNVRDLDHAVKFYRDVLGMEFLFTAPNMAFLQCGDLRPDNNVLALMSEQPTAS